jgi:hypothetical protein
MILSVRSIGRRSDGFIDSFFLTMSFSSAPAVIAGHVDWECTRAHRVERHPSKLAHRLEEALRPHTLCSHPHRAVYCGRPQSFLKRAGLLRERGALTQRLSCHS